MTTSTPAVQHCYTTGAADNRLHYLDYGGSGRPLVAMHGVLGNAWNWYQVAAGLADTRHVYAMDFRGYGESQRSAEGAYTTADHLGDLDAVLDSIGAGEVDLIGSSWGALAAIQYTAENPDRIGQLIVVDVEPSFEQSETDLFPRPTSYANADEVSKFEAQGNPNATPEMVAMMTATTYAPAADGRLVPKHDAYFFERWPFRADDHWARLETIQSPTLLLHATNSFVSGEVMAKMAARIPDASLIEVADSGHVIPVENPAAIVTAAQEFLA